MSHYDAAREVGYLKYSGKQARLSEVFFRWFDAKEIPCVSFEIDNDGVEMMSTNDSVENAESFLTLHFNVVSAGRPFTKARLVVVTDLLLRTLWRFALSPWIISAGVLPLSHGRQILADVYNTWDTTSGPKSESGVPSVTGMETSALHTVQ